MPLVPLPAQGRRYQQRRRVLLSDTTPEGRTRLDALARFLHDVATLDNTEAPLADKGLWVIRSIELDIATWPRYLDELDVITAVSGTGRAWAERRTDLARDGELLVSAAAIWVNTNPQTGAPASLPEGFEAVYGEAAQGRRVRPTLVLAEPDAAPDLDLELDLRLADLDIVDHVNNAVHLALVEEALWRAGASATLDGAPTGVRVEFPRALPKGERARVRAWLGAEPIVTIGDTDGTSSLTRVERR